LITITRRLALQLRAMLRRAFGNRRSIAPDLCFIADREALSVRAMFGDVAVEYQADGPHNANSQARKPVSRKVGQPDVEGLIEQAETIRTACGITSPRPTSC
jgi:hypothetical protein